MSNKKGEVALTLLILGVLAVSLVSAFSNLGSYTGGVVEDTGSINVNSNPELKNIIFMIETNNNKLELREPFGEVIPSVEGFMWDPLNGGTIRTVFGDTLYHQYLRFNSPTLNIDNPPYVNFTENDEAIEKVGDFLVVTVGGTDATDAFFEYELQFEGGLKSSIFSAKLSDLDDKNLVILGQTYVFVDTKIDTTNNEVKLVLLGGAVYDVLEEGEKKSYTIKGKIYDVQVVLITDQDPETVVFRVNGEQTSELDDGEVEILSDGILLGVSEVVSNEAGEAGGGDIVEFYIGANKLELEDKEYTDSNFESGVKIDNEPIEDALVRIDAEKNLEDQLSIKSIRYRLIADSKPGLDNIYVPPGHSVREFLDEPQGMLGQNWDIVYSGLETVGQTTITFVPSGDGEAYNLEFFDSEGNRRIIEPFIINRDKKLFFGDEILNKDHISMLGGGMLYFNPSLNGNVSVLNISLVTKNDKFNENGPLNKGGDEVLIFSIMAVNSSYFSDGAGLSNIESFNYNISIDSRWVFLLNDGSIFDEQKFDKSSSTMPLEVTDDFEWNMNHLAMTDYGMMVNISESLQDTIGGEHLKISYPSKQVTATAYLNFNALSEISCKDTDPENDIYVKGYVYGRSVDNTFNVSDTCYGFKSKYVLENICNSNNKPKSLTKKLCANGCSNGACISAPPVVEPTCTMSVNPTTISRGKNTNLRWNTTNATQFSINRQGMLLNGSILKTGINQTTTYSGKVRGPGGSNTCQTKVTVTQPPIVEPTCTDTDPQNNVYIKGELKAKGIGYAYQLADVCSGSKNVKERYCGVDKKPRDLIKTCPNNKKCITTKGICQK